MLAALTLATLALAPPQLPATGAEAPDFPIPAQRRFARLSDLRGRVVVLDFWATWCRPCTAELGDFERAAQTFGNRIAVVTVSDEPSDVAASYLRLWNIDLPLVQDTTGQVFRAYGVSLRPTTIILDPLGRVTYVSAGAESWSELAGAIAAAGAGIATSSPSPRVLP